MSRKNNLSIDFLFTDFIEFYTWLEVHDLMVRLNELLNHLLGGHR